MPPQPDGEPTEAAAPDVEVVDDTAGLVLRRMVVGPLDTNCWAVHAIGSTEALVVDPGDEPGRLLDALADLQVVGIVLTHAHFDHVLALPELADALGAPILAHPDDEPVWPHELDQLSRTGRWDAGTATQALLDGGVQLRPAPGDHLWHGRPDAQLHDGQVLRAGRLRATVLHTPGHTPGGVSLVLPGHVLTGDTLFPGGPGLTGWPLSDFPTIIGSCRRLLALPATTAVHPGHGPDTTIGHEQPHLSQWIDRGW